MNQRTIKESVSCSGIGLHSGKMVNITLRPAPEDFGIVFQRKDLFGKAAILKADFASVSFTTLCTNISNEYGTNISTIEHLMAAFWSCEIDNCLVEIDAAEIPAMDGSSHPFIFLIECAGVQVLSQERNYLKMLKTIEVRDGDKFVSISPADHFSIDIEVDFASKAISNQRFSFDNNLHSFKKDIARARTFGFIHEVEALRKMGLALGGSLENAVVISENDEIMNEGGLRFKDEFVRHKLLDCIGDLFTAGHYIIGHVNAYKTGHALNNKLLRAIFADPSSYCYSQLQYQHQEMQEAVAA